MRRVLRAQLAGRRESVSTFVFYAKLCGSIGAQLILFNSGISIINNIPTNNLAINTSIMNTLKRLVRLNSLLRRLFFGLVRALSPLATYPSTQDECH